MSWWIYGHFLIERGNYKKWIFTFLIANIIGSAIPSIGVLVAIVTGFVLGPLVVFVVCITGCWIGFSIQFSLFYGYSIGTDIILTTVLPLTLTAFFVAMITRKADPASSSFNCVTSILIFVVNETSIYIVYAFFALFGLMEYIPFLPYFSTPILSLDKYIILVFAIFIGPRVRSMILGPIMSPFSRPTGRMANASRRSSDIIRPQKLIIEPTTTLPTYDSPTTTTTEDTVEVKSGVDTAGEHLKVGIKIQNNGQLAITGVTVTFDAPEGLDYTKGSAATVRLGSIAPGGFQSAIFWLRPLRCIDDSYGGIVIFRDARDASHQIEIPRKRLVNICPMLEGTESPREIFAECKYGGLQRNSSAFKFAGDPAAVFSYANARVSSLVPVDKTQQNLGKENYLAYTCVVGKTKFGDKKFAAEIQVSGNPAGGILTLNVYSDDERILSGFFVDIMTDVRQHVEILEENNKIRPTNCPNCNAPLDLSTIDETRIYQCESCGSRGKIPPWLM